MINCMQLKTHFYRSTTLMLCFLLSPLPGFCQTGSSGQLAGSVTALDQAATRNGSGLSVRDQVQWNDQLQTNNTGRLRLNLRDGSILSLGSNSQMRVVQHNAATQQTTLELLFGRLRSQVVKLTQPNSRFEVRTPTSVAGVIGTDFLLIATADRTTLIVFSGVVQITPLNGAGGVPNQSQSVNVNSGQQVEVTTTGDGPVSTVTQQTIQQSIQQTAVSRAGLAAGTNVGVQAGTSILRTVLIAVGSVAAGAAVGVAVANSQHTSTPQKLPSGPGIPPQ
ncbi:MAG: hypothetical protein DMG61_19490 [Acidobacteria bacterium]|nr:MAG: hypothetical protein DMG61_19490 [Acidobacteriota bacterium]